MAAGMPLAPPDLERELAHLGELSLEELKARFEEITGAPLPKFLRRAFAERVVGYALQCQVLGAFDRDTKKQIEALMAAVVPAGAAKPRPKNRKLRAGTKLIREWQGRVYAVLVTGEGYLFKDQAFGSLSEIARAITGTKWNGWVFFGVKTPKAQTGPKKTRGRRPARHKDAGTSIQHGEGVGHG